VVYVCENNLYSISTRVDRQAPVTSVAERMRAYDLPAVVVDGNDVVAVTIAVDRAVQQARDGGGPSLVECLTYRQGGHKRDDPATYRPREEVEAWLRRDPLRRMRAALDQSGLGEQAAAVEREGVAAVDDAVAFAESSPLATGILA
jgi:TPP-dependent pyruvate/acetoin dehydrogenase alpha subunit